MDYCQKYLLFLCLGIVSFQLTDCKSIQETSSTGWAIDIYANHFKKVDPLILSVLNDYIINKTNPKDHQDDRNNFVKVLITYSGSTTEIEKKGLAIEYQGQRIVAGQVRLDSIGSIALLSNVLMINLSKKNYYEED